MTTHRPLPLGRLARAAAAFPLVVLSACSRPEAVSPVTAAAPAAVDGVTFNRHIQPILSENCYHCHGPDGSSRKGGLRLDRPEFAAKGGESGRPAFVPGDPARSAAMQRILSKDPQEVMPPPAMHNQLEPHEVELLAQWIKAGAVYEEHWAFLPPRRAPEPAVQRADWPRQPLDRFILARLEREGLAPSPEADHSTLIRRVTYDLTGLPPTPAETGAFLADPAPDAYERVVDRLLASPRYGEHRARYWLDVARYGDSHGLHGDYERTVWPYRDYVIRAFNANKPFDQFTRENLAGDLLPAETLDQQIASAFIRLGISSGEGGSIIQELRANNQRERVEAYGAAYLGLTTGCAACHDHKFDPLSQKDHYQLGAFFNNLTENPNDQALAHWPPFIRLPAAQDLAAYNAALAERAKIVRQLAERRAQAGPAIRDWLAGNARPPQAVAPAGLEVRLKFDEGQGNTLVNAAPGGGSVQATGAPLVWGEGTWFWPSMRMDTTTVIALPAAGDVDRAEAFTVASWVRPSYETARFSKAPAEGVLVARLGPGDDGRAAGWELVFVGERDEDDLYAKGGFLRFRLLGREGGAAAVQTTVPVFRSDRWNHVLAVADGSGRAEGLALYVDGVPQAVTVLQDDLRDTIRTPAPLLFGRRAPDAAPLRATAFQDFRFYRRALAGAEARRVPHEDHVAEIVAKAGEAWNDDERFAVTEFYLRERDEAARTLSARLPALNAQLEELTKGGVATLVSEEAPRPAYADVLDRGVYSARKERVRPDVPHFLPRLPAGASRDRRSLAEWTVSAENPLTARVTVNRMWAEIFGTGLVETTDDFGVVGARPSHPELLDQLAVDFRDSGWDVKRFYRQLVTSATYRQSARVTPELLEKDPGNRLLARGPRYRMDGEMLRDTVLATSGLLVEKQGGPSVKPYQPPGIWEAGTPPTSNTSAYVQQHGEALYRRSLYTFWKRMATMPNMNVFDAPDRDVSCTRRQRTTTPLQALVTMNDVQWLEAARVLGERLVREQPDDAARLDQLGRLMLARSWRDDERRVLTGLLGQFRATYAADPAAADRLLGVGEAPRHPGLPATEVAVWMLLASTAQNLDATLNK